MFTATADLVLPATVTGSWPRPRWFDVSMWGEPLDTCMMDVRFREKFQDALAVVVSDQERAGLDLVTNGDYHCDEDFAGRSWHHYPIQRWAGFEGDHLQSEATRSSWLKYPPGTLLHEIYTAWRWPRVTGKIEYRPLDYAKLFRMTQAKSRKPVKFGTCCSQVMSLFLDLHTDQYKDKRQVIWDMAEAMNKELLALRDAGCKVIQVEEPCFHFMANTLGKDHSEVRFMVDAYNREVEGLDDVEIWIHTCWGNPNMQRVMEDTELRGFAGDLPGRSERRRVDGGDEGPQSRDIELFERFKNALDKKIAIGAVSHRTLQADRPEEVAGEIRRAARIHPAGAACRLERLRIRPAGMQPGNRLLQGVVDRPGVQHCSKRAWPADDLCSRGGPQRLQMDIVPS